MTSIQISKKSGEYIGFVTSGHAEYADPGEDIICSAISVLVINTINSIEELTEDPFRGQADEETGRIEFELTDGCSHDAKLLLDSMVLGLQGIEREYGSTYLHLLITEV